MTCFDEIPKNLEYFFGIASFVQALTCVHPPAFVAAHLEHAYVLIAACSQKLFKNFSF